MAKNNRSNRDKEPGTELEKKINDRWEKDKDGFGQYCPKCSTWYPASSDAHNGH